MLDPLPATISRAAHLPAAVARWRSAIRPARPLDRYQLPRHLIGYQPPGPADLTCRPGAVGQPPGGAWCWCAVSVYRQPVATSRPVVWCQANQSPSSPGGVLPAGHPDQPSTGNQPPGPADLTCRPGALDQPHGATPVLVFCSAYRLPGTWTRPGGEALCRPVAWCRANQPAAGLITGFPVSNPSALVFCRPAGLS